MSITKKTWLRTLGISLVAITLFGIIGFLAFNFFKDQDNASASFPPTNCVTFEMQPGTSCGFLVEYSNGEGAETTNSRLTILVGNELELNEASFTEEIFLNGVTQGQKPINIANLKQTNTGGWGTRILYLPGTAENPSSQTGTLPATTSGKIRFQAKLKDDVLTRYSAGDILEPEGNTFNEGMKSFLSTAETPNPTQGIVKIKILGIETSSTSSSSNSIPQFPTDPANPLSSNSSSVTPSDPPNPLSVSSSSVPNSSSISTTNSSSSSISNPQPNTNPEQVVSQYGCGVNNCRLYFIGADNAALNWDAVTRSNLNWNKTQKFKDGTVKIVYDEIRKPDGNFIADNSTCKISLTRYGNNQILREYNGLTAGGKVEVSVPVTDQTVNYYTVIAGCYDASTNTSIRQIDRLVLIAGGGATTGGQNPTIEF